MSTRPAPFSFAPIAAAANSDPDSEPLTPGNPHPNNPEANPNANANVKLFSPPASVRSFSALGTNSPGIGFGGRGGRYLFPSPDSARAFSAYSVGIGAKNPPATADSLRPPPSHSYPPSATTTGANAGTRRKAFASPPARPLTMYTSPQPAGPGLRRERLKSTALLVPAPPLEKPWMGARDPHARLAYWITYGTVLLGLAAGAARIYLGWKSVLLLQGNLCAVLLEDFSGTDTAALFGEGGVFMREVDASGFGNGEFEMTTASDANSFVRDGKLYLFPTLTSDVIPMEEILNGTVYNLTDCTYNMTTGPRSTPLNLPAYLAACSAVSNATQGQILPPVMSARISTRRSASLKFGRVEVVAKLPTGDWLWPAIWMLPVGEAYGGWPLSGEIDIMESRGNGPSYPNRGANYVQSSLNWGPATFLDAVAKTHGWRMERRGQYDDAFHMYALEWSEDFIRMYVDSRLTHMLELKLNEPFWTRGDFPAVVQNGSERVVLQNPWVNGTKAAPFDQSFYLILNVAVGGSNGWFPDGPEKPWLDGSATAPRDFLQAQDQWYPTWPEDPERRAMVMCVPSSFTCVRIGY
ncbi:concanavalin A-like lectin/glucanase domain-containing protein [Mycena rosella]|uniref:Concanavalin A-like lectin/glucanase domain-containing protein n=1 Tax=Mycena rosella TaxID=1033263 RepID=A0AAD7G910_MYCRO|nr:concanavalin A-like lectin/glucanase domain-containing protein [Mycena rosella]